MPAIDAGLRHLHVVGGAGQAEVGDLDALDAVFEQDVGRLDVAMDQALLVSGGQAGGDLAADAEDLLQLQRAFAVDFVLERLAVDELHHQVGRLVRVVDGVDRDDVIVMHGRGGRGLAEEALDGGRIGGQLRGHHLDGHDAAELGVEGPQHDAHAAVADDFDDLVFAGLADELADAIGLVARLSRRAGGRSIRGAAGVAADGG